MTEHVTMQFYNWNFSKILGRCNTQQPLFIGNPEKYIFDQWQVVKIYQVWLNALVLKLPMLVALASNFCLQGLKLWGIFVELVGWRWWGHGDNKCMVLDPSHVAERQCCFMRSEHPGTLLSALCSALAIFLQPCEKILIRHNFCLWIMLSLLTIAYS